LIAAALLLTGSRAGLLAAAVGLTVFALASGRRTPLLLLALALIAALAVATPLNQRSLAESLRGRVFIWQVSLRDGPAQRPLGSGPGTFVYQYPSQLGRFFAQPGQELLQRFAGHERHAENDFVEAWHDTGWLGLGSLLALLASWLALARRRLSSAGDADRPALSMAIASVAALCCASCFDFPMHRAECWALLWLCLAVPLLPPSASAPPVGVNAAFQFVASTLLVVAGGVFGYAELVGSFQLAQGLNDEKEDRLAAATEDYRQALRWEPASQDANFNLVRTLAKAGDDSSALAQATIAAHFVNEPELFLLRSRILQNQGRYCEAGREIQNALQLFPYAQELRDEAATVPCFADLSQDPPR